MTQRIPFERLTLDTLLDLHAACATLVEIGDTVQIETGVQISIFSDALILCDQLARELAGMDGLDDHPTRPLPSVEDNPMDETQPLVPVKEKATDRIQRYIAQARVLIAQDELREVDQLLARFMGFQTGMLGERYIMRDPNHPQDPPVPLPLYTKHPNDARLLYKHLGMQPPREPVLPMEAVECFLRAAESGEWSE